MAARQRTSVKCVSSRGCAHNGGSASAVRLDDAAMVRRREASNGARHSSDESPSGGSVGRRDSPAHDDDDDSGSCGATARNSSIKLLGSRRDVAAATASMPPSITALLTGSEPARCEARSDDALGCTPTLTTALPHAPTPITDTPSTTRRASPFTRIDASSAAASKLASFASTPATLSIEQQASNQTDERSSASERRARGTGAHRGTPGHTGARHSCAVLRASRSLARLFVCLFACGRDDGCVDEFELGSRGVER